MNSRFAVAVHILTLLDQTPDTPLSSEYIATSVNTNPSLIRRLLTTLGKAGLTRSQLGSGGGTSLARAAGRITLLDVYRAIGENELFAMHRERPNPNCPVGRNIQGALEGRMGTAAQALETELAGMTLADLSRDVRSRERKRRAASAPR